jgi:glycosyltransferase involved in cell wall biosynthesis
MTAFPHILVFEPESTGHQMEYLRHLLNGIDQQVEDVRVTLLTTAEAAEHPNCQRLVNDFRQLVTVRIAPTVREGSAVFRTLGTFYERQWKNAESLDRALSEIGPETVDFILLPHLETIGLLHLGLRRNLFRGKPWATIAIAIRFHHRKCGIEGPFRWLDVLQSVFFRRVLQDPNLICFGTINPYLTRATSNPKVAYCPDPCAVPVLSSAQEARTAYGIRLETCVVLVFGFIDGRKCVDILLKGAARVIPELDLTVLLAGPQHPGHLAPVMNGDAARKLRDQGRLIEVNRFILSAQDIDPMSAADIAWVFYERNFVNTSSVLVRSGLSGRPVIARRQGAVGRLVEEHRLGFALSSDAPEAVAAALTKLVRGPALRHEMGENGAEAFADNTPANFARPIVEAMNRTFARGRSRRVTASSN